MATFCSPYHAQVGENRWQEKINKNIRMGVPPKEEEPEALNENTDELIES